MFIVRTMNKEFHIEDRIQITISMNPDKEFYRLQLLFENEYGKDRTFITGHYNTHKDAEFARNFWTNMIRDKRNDNIPFELSYMENVIEKAIEALHMITEKERTA